MAKKRKAERLGLDEVERTVFSSFCTAANAISQLYTQAQHQQKLAFQAGERHGLEKLYMWLQKEQQQGSNVTTAQILDHVRNQVEGSAGRDEVATPPGPHAQPWFSGASSGVTQHSAVSQGGTGAAPNSGMARVGGPTLQRRGMSGGGEALHEGNVHYVRHQDFPTSFQQYSVNSQAGGAVYGHIPPHHQERSLQSVGGDDANMDI